MPSNKPSVGAQRQATRAGSSNARDTFPWIGRVLPWSAALRDKPYQNPHSCQGILKDIPRDTRLLIVGRERGWLRVEVTLGVRRLKGYVSQELIEYVSPEISAASEKVAQYKAALAVGDWPEAAKLLNGLKDADILTLLKQLSARELAHMKSGALHYMPALCLRVTKPIERLHPFAGVVGAKLATAHKKLEMLRAEFHVEVVSRQAWGARPYIKSRGWTEYPKNAPLPLVRIVVHHTAEPLTQTVKQLQDKEMDEAGYADMPYHFVITANGKIHEGRTIDAVGAHAGEIKGNKDIKKDPDYGSIGIVVTGDFESRAVNLWNPNKPTAQQLESLQRLLNHLSQKYKIDPANIIKHREVARGGKETVCPGAILSPHVDVRRKETQRILKELATAEAELKAAEKEASMLK